MQCQNDRKVFRVTNRIVVGACGNTATEERKFNGFRPDGTVGLMSYRFCSQCAREIDSTYSDAAVEARAS